MLANSIKMDDFLLNAQGDAMAKVGLDPFKKLNDMAKSVEVKPSGEKTLEQCEKNFIILR